MSTVIALHIALPVVRCTLPDPCTGLAVAETGELMLCAGAEMHSLHLDAAGWAWLAQMAADMAQAKQALPEANAAFPHLTHAVAGHA